MRDKLIELLRPLLAALVAAVGSVGFVAFVGAAILWARWTTAELPADQGVAVVPREELVAVGAAALVAFALLGVVAVLGVYLIDRGGRPTAGMRWGLLALLAVELGVAVVRADFRGSQLVVLAAGFAAASAAMAVLLNAAAELWGGIPAGERSVATAVRRVGTGAAGLLRRRSRDPRRGVTLVLLVVALSVGLALLVATEPWLALLVGVVVVLTLVNLAVAHATGPRFALYGLAVFGSVAVFGAASNFIRAVDTPVVQAAAALRADDPRGVCALYVGETDDRLYLGRVELRRGATDTRPASGSGRLFWLPKDKLAAWSIGPLQSIGRAQAQAVRLRDELVAERPPAPARAKARPRPAPAGAQAAAAAAPAAAPATDLCSPRGRRTAERVTRARTLARRFQPILAVDRRDRFWPTSVTSIYDYRGGRGRNRRTCLQAPGSACERIDGPADIPWTGGENEWLEFPAANTVTSEQADMVRRALGTSNPYASARMYFLVVGGRAREQLTSLQYWFYYPFNYQRLPGPVRGGYHEGDFESVGVLLSRRKRPVFVWTARHGSEGERYAFGEPGLRTAGTHPRVFAARGSHATYASCGRQRRPLLRSAVDDVAPCPSDNPLMFEPQATPLSDLAHAPWACFRGRFGHLASATGPLARLERAILANGPRSPLWQQKFGPRRSQPCADVDEPADRGRPGEETSDDATAQRIRDGAGSLAPLFSSCVFWRQRPAQGAYVSACDPAILDRFFRSGLDDRGPERLRITTRRGSRVGTVPALLRTFDPAAIDGARISARAASRPEIYVARYVRKGSRRLLTATFAPVLVRPGGALRLRTAGTARWRLVDGAGRTVAEAEPVPFGAPARAAGPSDVNSGADSG